MKEATDLSSVLAECTVIRQHHVFPILIPFPYHSFRTADWYYKILLVEGCGGSEVSVLAVYSDTERVFVPEMLFSKEGGLFGLDGVTAGDPTRVALGLMNDPRLLDSEYFYENSKWYMDRDGTLIESEKDSLGIDRIRTMGAFLSMGRGEDPFVRLELDFTNPFAEISQEVTDID